MMIFTDTSSKSESNNVLSFYPGMDGRQPQKREGSSQKWIYQTTNGLITMKNRDKQLAFMKWNLASGNSDSFFIPELSLKNIWSLYLFDINVEM